ncbi:hypothetical protein PoB_000482800 [Plakobranchus ocellatus]|uniref:Uncharacterized protein n=1 Tax=Plakobranchus ocellatus TaxID=259542 RepID=A0AAV3Y805_9GAST|nr:hypothetical protein PoB_000482800 [Plakobranchus ocellatus]
MSKLIHSATLFLCPQLNAEVACQLEALDNSVTRPSLMKCARFLVMEFREPGQHLPMLTLTQPYLVQTCLSLMLYPAQLRADLRDAEFYCVDGFRFNADNFRCIEETLPQYTAGVEMIVEGRFQGDHCQDAIRVGSVKLGKQMISNIQTRIYERKLCDSTSDVLALFESPQVFIEKLQAVILLPVVLSSLSHKDEDCMNCMKEIYTYLGTALAQPASHLVQVISTNCSSQLSMPSDFTIAYNNWKCQEGFRFDVKTHSCERPVGVSIAAPDTLAEDLKNEGK